MPKKTEKKSSKKKAGKKNLPATQSSKAVSKDLAGDMVQDAQSRAGLENITSDDVAIPFLSILQAMSPQVRGATKIKGAKEGDFFNNVTGEIFEGPISVIPCAFVKKYVEWIPRDQGGGFVASHDDESILAMTTRDDKGHDIHKETGNQIVRTAYHYVLHVKDDGSVVPVVLSFTSTQLKKSRRWNSQQLALKITDRNGRKLTPPSFSHTYQVDSVEESNEKGAWMGFDIGQAEIIGDAEVYAEAKSFHNDIHSGAVQLGTPPAEGGSNAPDDPEYM